MGNWIQTFTGKQVFPTELRAEDVCPTDIAHALSLQCRYAGHTKWHYSVAQHSVLICDHAFEITGNETTALVGLLHDAPEAYLVDLPSPIKAAMPIYQEIERQVSKSIAKAFGLESIHSPFIRSLDLRIRQDERATLLGPPPADWDLPWLPLDVRIDPWTPERAEYEFTARIYQHLNTDVCGL
jgi:hypothetical protein